VGKLIIERVAVGVEGEESGEGMSQPQLDMAHFSHKIWLLVAFLRNKMTGNGETKVQTTLLTVSLLPPGLPEVGERRCPSI